MEEALGSTRCSNSSLQRPDKHRTATTTPQCKARKSRFIFHSLPGVDYGSWHSAPKIWLNMKINLCFKLHSLSFGLGIFLFLDRTTTTPVFAGSNISLFPPQPHHSKSPSLAFDPLINNFPPVLGAVTSRKKLDTRFLGTRMLGLPMGFGIGQFPSCQNQYLDERWRFC